MIVSTDPEEDEFGIDEDFDNLLAQIPLPESIPTTFTNPTESHSQSQSRKRKEIHNSDNDTTTSSNCYDAIQFGQIGQYMANKRLKLKVQESLLRDADGLKGSRPQFMAGLVIHVNGYTTPPLSEIRKMIVVHGGTYMAYLDHKSVITHIIATALTPKKREEFRLYKVVTPSWLVDSVEAGRLLPWSDYTLNSATKNISKNIMGGEVTGGLPGAQRTLFSMSKETGKPGYTQVTPKPTPSSISTSHHKHPSNLLAGLNKGKSKYTPTPPLTSAPSTSSPDQNRSEPVTDHSPAPRSDAGTSVKPTDNTDDVTPILDSNAPNFIQEYFKQSRLHHLSTWKADLLQKVSTLTDKKVARTGKHLPPKKLIGDETDGRTIMHIDFDCFFISAGLIKRPDLRGKPVAVCHAQTNQPTGQRSTSEIASCSYEARAFGVKNGQTLGKAREICPQIQTIPYDFKLYEEISLKFYNILLSYADELQAVSVDECLIDISSKKPNSSSTEIQQNALTELANEIRAKIRSSTGCEASIGISHNILLAKLATKKAKPAGTYHLHGPQITQLLGDLKIDDLPGVGWAQKSDIETAFQVSNVAQLGQISVSQLIDVMGPIRGKTLHLYSKGIDDRPLKSSHHDRKSVSAVVNYGIRFKNQESGGAQQSYAFIKELSLEVSRRLVELGLRGRHLSLKIMKRAANAPVESAKFMGHGVCDELSRTNKISGPGDSATDDGLQICEEAWKLLKTLNIPPEDLRGIGIQIQKLEKNKVGQVNNTNGQSTLTFKPGKLQSSFRDLAGPPKVVQAITPKPNPPNKCMAPKASTSKQTLQSPPPCTQLIIPSSSQIDPEVVDALPTPMRNTVMKSIDLSRASTTIKTPSNQVRQANTSYDQLPSASQVDWTFLSELPSSVRKPIEELYERRKREQDAALLPPPQPDFAKKSITEKTSNKRAQPTKAKSLTLRFPVKDTRSNRKTNGVHRVTPIGPSQRLISKRTFKLISRPQPKPIDLTVDAEDSSQETNQMLPTPNRITDEQLEALEIDVRFFRELSSARAFQLDLIYDQYQTHQDRFKEVTAANDRWRRWRKRFGQASKVLSLEFIEKPYLLICDEREERNIKSFEDVSVLIEELVKEDEVDSVMRIEEQSEMINQIEKFLFECLDKKRKSGQELEKVYKLMIWWEEMIREKWIEMDCMGRKEWEKVVEGIKDRIDLVCERDHGACLF
ncbi:hypothetical protein DFH28DRAFT_1021465 [Melampsora americana]|nr:hypothetical protein DFH28DRAFT_1021465 [Melampsora americana]